jgi:hypothetical protein
MTTWLFDAQGKLVEFERSEGSCLVIATALTKSKKCCTSFCEFRERSFAFDFPDSGRARYRGLPGMTGEICNEFKGQDTSSFSEIFVFSPLGT